MNYLSCLDTYRAEKASDLKLQQEMEIKAARASLAEDARERGNISLGTLFSLEGLIHWGAFAVDSLL